MGTYSTWEFYETFGGWPEEGETYPDDPDAVRDAAQELELAEPCPHCGRTGGCPCDEQFEEGLHGS